METKKSWIKRHPILTVLLVLFAIPFIGGMISAMSGDTKPSTSQPNQQAQQEPVKKEVIFPVEIVSSKITKDSIGTPILNLTIKNTSKKTIDALEIDANFFDNFNEPAGKFGVGDNSIIATSQEKIAPGETMTRSWNLAVYDSATKVDGVKIKRLHFTDGETISAE